jgi:hypothetical protein
MAFDFSCTSCGIPLTQGTVLFDFLNALREEDSQETRDFTYLKLYLREEEIRRMITAGEDLGRKNPQKMGHVRCQLSFQNLLSLMGNADNFNIPGLEKVSYAEVEKFAEWKVATTDEETSAKSADDEELTADEKEELRKEKAAARKKAREAAQAEFEKSTLSMIVRRQSDDQTSKELVDRMDDLKSDFQMLKRYIEVKDQEAFITFVINPIYNKVSVSGEELLTGYQIYDDWDNLISSNQEARVCPNCHEKLFEGAGTAQQRVIVFIGSKGTGKTSTILSLAHYLQYRHIQTSDLKKRESMRIWENKERCAVEEVHLANNHERMVNEIVGFEQGIAPAKTDRKGKGIEAYSITLKVRNKDNKESFLSMLDVPGEICNEETGNIDEVEAAKFKILNHCDAYALCFEHPEGRAEREKIEAEKEAANDEKKSNSSSGKKDNRGKTMTGEQMVCNWATQIQEMRKKQSQSVGFVPMMLLFTKCPQLEDENRKKEADNAPNPKDLYLFKDERCVIQSKGDDNIFTPLLNTFEKSASLKEAFYSTMRCSPFGFRADKAGESKEENKQTPKPQNIDKLMRWILYVTGCVPLEVNVDGIKKYYLTPPECRNLLPEEKFALDNHRPLPDERDWKSPILHWTNLVKSLFSDEWKAYAAIARARWMLFENFNSLERGYANNSSSKARLYQAAIAAYNHRRTQANKIKE